MFLFICDLSSLRQPREYPWLTQINDRPKGTVMGVFP